MKTLEYKTTRDGEERSGLIAIPENIQEAIRTMGEEKVYQHFKYSYVTSQKVSIKNKRRAKEKRSLRIELKTLTPIQRAALEKAGIL